MSLKQQLIEFVQHVYDSWKDYDDVNDEVRKMVADARELLDKVAMEGPFHYTLLYRPPSMATLPRESWSLIEIPKNASHHWHRPELKVSAYPFGVVEFGRPLSEDEAKQYELKRVWL